MTNVTTIDGPLSVFLSHLKKNRRQNKKLMLIHTTCLPNQFPSLIILSFYIRQVFPDRRDVFSGYS